MQCFLQEQYLHKDMNISAKDMDLKNDGSQDNEIITKIHRLFLERIRKKTGKSVKHWCVTEKGHTNTRRIHLHGLFYAREGQTKWQLTKLLYENGESETTNN